MAQPLVTGSSTSVTLSATATSRVPRPLPGIADPGRLVSVSRIQDGNVFDNFGYPDYLDYSDRARSLAGLAGFCTAPLSMTTDGTNRVRGDLVTDNYFDVLGVKPAIGRLLRSGDGQVAVKTGGRHAV